MMRYRKLSADGDYVFGQNGQDFYTGVDAVAQAIQTNLLLFKGEWWEDLQDGLPFFQSIAAQKLKNGTAGIDLLIRERILNTQGVQSITNFSSSFDPVTRSYSFTATVNTQYGAATVGSVM